MKKVITLFNDKLLASLKISSRKERILLLIAFYLIIISTFITLVGQLPFFATRGLTQLFQIPWLFVIFPAVILSYKFFVKKILNLLLVISPFILYLVVASFLKIPSISFRGTTLVFMCFYIFLIGSCLSPYFNKFQFKSICLAFLLGSLLYAAVIYVSKLRGVDISGSIYAVSTKNSTSPILLIGFFCSCYLFDKRNFLCIFANIFVGVIMVILIALMKCRTILICLPFIFLVLLHFYIKNRYLKFGIIFLLIIAIVLLFVVPFLREKIIVDILLNGKTTPDEIFSGRLSQIMGGFSKFKPVLGDGNSYVDCMPICFLLCYGIVGFLALLPFSVLPISALIGAYQDSKSKTKKLLVACFLVLFFFEYLFEGFGYFGPGAKTFIFWLLAGFESNYIFKESRSKTFRRIDAISESASLRISAFTFLSIVEVIVVLFTSISYPFDIYLNSVSEFLYKKIPSNAVVTEYVAPKDIELVSEVRDMCIGQKIKYKFVCSNDDCDDSIFGYMYNGNYNLSVDTETNTVTALNNYPFWTCFLYNKIRTNDVTNSYLFVYEVDKYDFNNIYISTNQFTESFEYAKDELLDIGINTYQQVYYDNFYVPNTVSVVFNSSNPNVAYIDPATGIIKGISAGQCDITASITNSKGIFISKNKISLNVLPNDEFVKCSELELTYDNDVYQYVPFKLKPIFNEGASDCSIIYDISGVDYILEGDRLLFLGNGKAKIKAKSVSNPNLVTEVNIDVIENKPTHFSCQKKIVQVGKVYSPKDLGLYLHFSNGYSTLVSDDVLKYSAADLSGRAWYETNGMVKNHCSFKAVKTGYASLSLTCLYDENVKTSFSFEIIKYTENQYKSILTVISSILVIMISVISYFGAFILNAKKKIVKSIIVGFLTILYCILSVIFIGVNIFSLIVCSIYFAIALILILINRIKLKDGWPNILSDYVPQSSMIIVDEEKNNGDGR